MILDTVNTVIELVAPEADAFLGKAPATASMLEWQGTSYKTFLTRVEDRAEQLFIETERTVFIYNVESGDAIAIYNECGLVIPRSRQPRSHRPEQRRRK